MRPPVFRKEPTGSDGPGRDRLGAKAVSPTAQGRSTGLRSCMPVRVVVVVIFAQAVQHAVQHMRALALDRNAPLGLAAGLVHTDEGCRCRGPIGSYVVVAVAGRTSALSVVESMLRWRAWAQPSGRRTQRIADSCPAAVGVRRAAWRILRWACSVSQRSAAPKAGTDHPELPTPVPPGRDVDRGWIGDSRTGVEVEESSAKPDATAGCVLASAGFQGWIASWTPWIVGPRYCLRRDPAPTAKCLVCDWHMT